MAMRVEKSWETDGNPNSVKVKIYSDTKAEVASTSTDDILGFPKGKNIEMGSKLYTADADIAIYKSDGTWNWV